MEICEKVAFQLIEIRKMNISRNINMKYVTDVFLSVGSTRMKFILVIRGWAHKSQTVTYISIKITRSSKDWHKYVYDYRYIQLAYLKYRTQVTEFSTFISVRYTITDLQTP